MRELRWGVYKDIYYITGYINDKVFIIRFRIPDNKP